MFCLAELGIPVTVFKRKSKGKANKFKFSCVFMRRLNSTMADLFACLDKAGAVSCLGSKEGRKIMCTDRWENYFLESDADLMNLEGHDGILVII